jgi:hypothetical protein
MKVFSEENSNSLVAASIRSFATSAKYDNEKLEDHLSVLARQNYGVVNQNKETLLAQANSLDAIFNGLASHVGDMISKNPYAVDKYLRLALKAQAQCVRTIEVLMRYEDSKLDFDDRTIS